MRGKMTIVTMLLICGAFKVQKIIWVFRVAETQIIFHIALSVLIINLQNAFGRFFERSNKMKKYQKKNTPKRSPPTSFEEIFDKKLSGYGILSFFDLGTSAEWSIIALVDFAYSEGVIFSIFLNVLVK